jgi:hypothetical protein
MRKKNTLLLILISAVFLALYMSTSSFAAFAGIAALESAGDTGGAADARAVLVFEQDMDNGGITGLEFAGEADGLLSAASLVGARFEGLTRIVVELDAPLSAITKADVKIDNILSIGNAADPGYWRVPETDIKSVAVSGNEVVISLADYAFFGQGILRGKMAKDACVAIGAGSPVALPRQGASLASVANRITRANANPASGGNNTWHDLGGGNHRVDAGTDQANWVNELNRYSLVGMPCHMLFIVFDFPDAKAESNTGITASPGSTPTDRYNYVRGERLSTAKHYYDWLSTGSKSFLSAISFNNINVTWTLVENSAPSSLGVYRLPYSLYPNRDYLPGGDVYEADKRAGKDMSNLYALYPWLATNPDNWAGYAFDRGGSTANWTSATYGIGSLAAVVRPDLDAMLAKLPEGAPGTATGPRFTGVYYAVVENAPGISYGTSNSGGGNLAVNLGYSATGARGYALQWNSYMGADSYGAFKWKHLTHELAHQFGVTDYYLEGMQPDPYVGSIDTHFGVGGFDHQGYITNHSPDLFGWMKWKFGWFRDDQSVVISDDGTYTVELTPMNTEAGTKIIVIPGEQRGVVFVIEYRGGYTGADDIKRLENSTDPFDPSGALSNGESLKWYIQKSTRFGTENSPGILMYETNGNYSGTGAMHTRVIDLMPRSLDNSEGYGPKSTSGWYATTLMDSLLGPASDKYVYADAAYGISVSLDTKLVGDAYMENSPVTVTVKKTTPPDKDRAPVLFNAAFIDQNTIQFQASMDMRTVGRAANWQILRNGQALAAVFNQTTSNTVRLTVSGSAAAGPPFTMADITGSPGAATVTVKFNPTGSAGYQYLPSDPVTVGPSPNIKSVDDIGVVTLSNVRFTSATTFVAVADKDLSGFSQASARSALRVTKPDGTVLTSAQVTGASFARASRILTVTLASGVFADLSSTVGATVELIAPVSNFGHNVGGNALIHRWYHDVTVNKTDKAASSLVASVSGGFEGMYFEKAQNQIVPFNIIGGTAAGIRTKFDLDIRDGKNKSVNVSGFGLFVYNRITGESTPLATWLASFNAAAGFPGYNGIDEFPMTTNMSLMLLFIPPSGAKGNYTYTLTLSSPTDLGLWASIKGGFSVVQNNFTVYMKSGQNMLDIGDTLLVDVMLLGDIYYSQFAAEIAYDATLLEFAGYDDLRGWAASAVKTSPGSIAVRSIPAMNMVSGAPCSPEIKIVTLKFTVKDSIADNSITTDLNFISRMVSPPGGVTGSYITAPGQPLNITINNPAIPPVVPDNNL